MLKALVCSVAGLWVATVPVLSIDDVPRLKAELTEAGFEVQEQWLHVQEVA